MTLRLIGAVLVCLLLAALGCGGGQMAANLANPVPVSSPSPAASPTPGEPPPSPPAATTIPAPDHVFLVVLENHGFSQVIGSSAMPYLNSLATAHALATDYYANTHPSIGNYFMLTTGNVETNSDTFSGTVSADNIPRAFAGAGKTWKAYMESLPKTGYTGGDVYPYLKHHDPFVYMTDVLNSAAERANVVPFSRLATDLNAGTLPRFAYIVPNAEDDAHDCPGGGSACTDAKKLAAADSWLKSRIGPLINSPALANSVFIITFDESRASDATNGGGKVATVILGAHVKKGFRSTRFYQHQSTLRLVLDLLRVSDHPGNSATAPTMQEFFQ